MDEGKISLFEGHGASSVNTFSVRPLSFSRFLSLSIYLSISLFLSFFLQTPFHGSSPGSRPAGKTAQINERIKALPSYYSLCTCRFSRTVKVFLNDEREDKLVGKSSRCCANTPAGESAGWPSRGGRFGVAFERRGCWGIGVGCLRVVGDAMEVEAGHIVERMGGSPAGVKIRESRPR